MGSFARVACPDLLQTIERFEGRPGRKFIWVNVIESRFDRALKRGKPAGGQRAQYWDLYADFYRNITEMPDNQLPHVFVEAFARAYSAARKQGKTGGG